jgi:hypothetical protein
MPLLDLALENLNEDLEYRLRRANFVLPSHFNVVVLVLIDYIISWALALLGKLHEKRATELAQVAKIAELEVVTRPQADKITDLEATCADLKREEYKVTDGYWMLAEKHKALAKKAEQEKMKLAEAHVSELNKLHEDFDLEICSYTKYHQNVRCRLHELHEMVASSFDEVKAQCLPFPDKGAKVEEMIDWVVREVRAVPDIIWQLNDNFAVLGIEGVLIMLDGEGCRELSWLRDLAASRNAMVLEDVLKDVQKLAGRIVRKWWKPHGLPKALQRLEQPTLRQ